MGLIVKSRKHLFIRIPVISFLIAVLGLSPILISMIGARITEWSTGQPCHEGNCFWGGFGWLFLVTMPLAGIVFMIFAVIVVVDVIGLLRSGDDGNRSR